MGTTKESDDISRIRDLLMGSNLSQFERKIEKTGQEALETTQLIENRLNRQLSEIRQTIETLRQEQSVQLQSNKSDLKAIADELRERVEKLDEKLSQLTSSTEALIQDTRQWASGRHEQLISEQQMQLQEHRNAIGRQLQDLYQAKVDRQNLALLFSEIAVQLGGDELQQPH